MHQTFFQKIMITIFAGFVAACMLWAFKHVFEEANNAVGNATPVTHSVSH